MTTMTKIRNKLPVHLDSQQYKNFDLRFVSNLTENLEKYMKIF